MDSGIRFVGVWGDAGASSSASRTPVHGWGFEGGMKRPAPSVDAPYGIPLKAFPLPWLAPNAMPRTLPAVVCTTGFSESTLAAHALVSPPARTPRTDLRFIALLMALRW